MAGRRNQAQLAALQLLRDRTSRQEEAIRAWQQSLATVTALDAELEELRAGYEAQLAALRRKRAEAANRSDTMLGAVALLIGDAHQTARLLGVPLNRVARARAKEYRARSLRDQALTTDAGAP